MADSKLMSRGQTPRASPRWLPTRLTLRSRRFSAAIDRLPRTHGVQRCACG